MSKKPDWETKYDEQFPLKEGAFTFSGKRAKDFIRSTLEELAVKVEGMKEGTVCTHYQDNCSCMNAKDAKIHDTALDRAAALIRSEATIGGVNDYHTGKLNGEIPKDDVSRH